LNSTLAFLAAMPPSTVRGKVMRDHRKMMMTMVPKGRAAVDCGRQAGRSEARVTCVSRAWSDAPGRGGGDGPDAADGYGSTRMWQARVAAGVLM